MAKYQVQEAVRIESLILTVRGLRVMLDSDLAKIYGVTTIRLNEQFKRNRKRFPADFAFQLTREEFAGLRSQIAISRLHGGRRYSPWVFTEHGALMLGNVLNSETAQEASVRVERTFMLMREQLAAHKELSQKLSELETRVSGHDEAIANLFEAIRQLVEPVLPEDRRQIGFMREATMPYRICRSCRN
jgi:ORF6N domain